MKTTIKSAVVIAALFLGTAFAQTKPSVSYEVHVEKDGWTSTVENGNTAGTTGEKKQMEAVRIRVKSPDIKGGIKYQVHITSVGWAGASTENPESICGGSKKNGYNPCDNAWVADGKLAGTTGETKRLEAIKIELTGELAQKYNVEYRVHMKDRGWGGGWSRNGEIAGTIGQKKQIEAIEIKLTEK